MPTVTYGYLPRSRSALPRAFAAMTLAAATERGLLSPRGHRGRSAKKVRAAPALGRAAAGALTVVPARRRAAADTPRRDALLAAASHNATEPPRVARRVAAAGVRQCGSRGGHCIRHARHHVRAPAGRVHAPVQRRAAVYKLCRRRSGRRRAAAARVSAWCRCDDNACARCLQPARTAARSRVSARCLPHPLLRLDRHGRRAALDGRHVRARGGRKARYGRAGGGA